MTLGLTATDACAGYPLQQFRENRGTGLQFHIDIARFDVAAIRAWLDNELALARRAQTDAQRDWQRASSRLHPSDPMSGRELQRLQQVATEADDRTRRLEGFDRDWDRFEPDFRRWAAAQAEVSTGGGSRTVTGVLLGHETVVDTSPHRFVAHINVEGVRIVEGANQDIKAVIYVLNL